MENKNEIWNVTARLYYTFTLCQRDFWARSALCHCVMVSSIAPVNFHAYIMHLTRIIEKHSYIIFLKKDLDQYIKIG